MTASDVFLLVPGRTGHYLIASDFDQTLSFNDSGIVLSELIGASNFREKVSGLSDIHLVQQGAELAYVSAASI
ncbi:MAG TPA: hypothetical protein VJX71_11805 [Methylomirabilota bacterium]|nr:hypothetical protein [Methylomirabilota bacterium]